MDSLTQPTSAQLTILGSARQNVLSSSGDDIAKDFFSISGRIQRAIAVCTNKAGYLKPPRKWILLYGKRFIMLLGALKVG
jgi:hypothetical protein